MSKKIAPHEYAKAFIDATKDASREEIRKRVEVLYTLLKRDHNEHLFPRIIQEAETYIENEGTVRVQVETGVALTSAQKNMLAEAIGQNADVVRWQEQVNESLGAGLRVTIGDTIIDATMHGRLELLRKSLLSS